MHNRPLALMNLGQSPFESHEQAQPMLALPPNDIDTRWCIEPKKLDLITR